MERWSSHIERGSVATQHLMHACLLVSLFVIAGCLPDDPVAPDIENGGPPVEGFSREQWPLDRQPSPGDPSTYKGLPLAMFKNVEPVVTAVNGKIGVVCIGGGNARDECAAFIDRLPDFQAQGDVSPEVVVVNCAGAEQGIERWIDAAVTDSIWTSCTDVHLPEAGLSREQVRVIWHKAASGNTQDATGAVFPAYPDPQADYFRFRISLGAFARRPLLVFPEVRAVYISSRSFGGFGPPERGEPLSYEEGLALNDWLQSHATIDGKWFGWGAYLWAPDCDTGRRNGAGICYARNDFGENGYRLTPAGSRRRAS